jgi:SAM-dependent methyltransferase
VEKDDPADGWFPESVAADYDTQGGANAPEVVVPMADVLEDLADGGPVLEFAVGTGRVAAPLAARGVAVSGIELSRAMAARITGKPGGDKVAVTIGDMTTTRVAGQFSLVYLVFNTISNVTTQDGQVDVFCNAAAPAAGPGHRPVHGGARSRRRRLSGVRSVRHRDPAVHVESRHRVGRRERAVPAYPVPVCLAGRDGSHGAYRGIEPEIPLGGLGPVGIHGGEHHSCVGLAEALREFGMARG